MKYRNFPKNVILCPNLCWRSSLIALILFLDGIAVDPECHLDDFAHVYCDKVARRTIKYSVILGLVDIQKNKNSFYRMQLLESDKNEQKK